MVKHWDRLLREVVNVLLFKGFRLDEALMKII